MTALLVLASCTSDEGQPTTSPHAQGTARIETAYNAERSCQSDEYDDVRYSWDLARSVASLDTSANVALAYRTGETLYLTGEVVAEAGGPTADEWYRLDPTDERVLEFARRGRAGIVATPIFARASDPFADAASTLGFESANGSILMEKGNEESPTIRWRSTNGRLTLIERTDNPSTGSDFTRETLTLVDEAFTGRDEPEADAKSLGDAPALPAILAAQTWSTACTGIGDDLMSARRSCLEDAVVDLSIGEWTARTQPAEWFVPAQCDLAE